jgi:hypothetical protein
MKTSLKIGGQDGYFNCLLLPALGQTQFVDGKLLCIAYKTAPWGELFWRSSAVSDASTY